MSNYKNNQNLLVPKNIHLSLTSKNDEMMISWITKGKISNQPIVHLFKGDCSIISNSNNFKELLMDKELFNISVGKTNTYNGFDGYIHSVIVGDLEFGRTYCYSVGSSGSGNDLMRPDFKQLLNGNKNNNNNNGNIEEELKKWSIWKTFKTESNDIDHITFGAFADSGTWGDVHQVIDIMSKDESLTLSIHGGDLSYGLKEEVWDTFGEIVEPLTSRTPFMVIPGNWDVKEGALLPFINRYQMPLVYKQPTIELKYNDDDNDDSKTSDGANKAQLKSYPNLYYSFTYTHCYFIMLSSYDPYQIGSQQYKWLLKELEHANTVRSKYPWLIVVAHSPMYSSSTGHGGSDKNIRLQLETLYQIYNVNLVFSGHDHGYERSYPVYNENVLKKHSTQYQSKDGTIHILGGTGGATADPWFEQQPKWSAIRESTSGYTKFIAHKQTLQVTYIRINGTMGDHFQITNDYPSIDPIKTKKSIVVNSSEHTGLLLLFFALLIFVFPLCAYYKIPNLIFQSLIPKQSNKSFV